MNGYIHDGYTLTGFIKGRDRLYPDLRFTYRPVIIQNRSVIFNAISQANQAGKPAEAEAIAAKACKSHLLSWDLTGKGGETLPTEADHVVQIPPELNNRLFRVLMGQDAPDLDTEESNGSGSGAALDLALSGAAPAELMEQQAGNSQAG